MNEIVKTSKNACKERIHELFKNGRPIEVEQLNKLDNLLDAGLENIAIAYLHFLLQSW